MAAKEEGVRRLSWVEDSRKWGGWGVVSAVLMFVNILTPSAISTLILPLHTLDLQLLNCVDLLAWLNKRVWGFLGTIEQLAISKFLTFSYVFAGKEASLYSTIKETTTLLVVNIALSKWWESECSFLPRLKSYGIFQLPVLNKTFIASIVFSTRQEEVLSSPSNPGLLSS